jgi:hypothetical protein
VLKIRSESGATFSRTAAAAAALDRGPVRDSLRRRGSAVSKTTDDHDDDDDDVVLYSINYYIVYYYYAYALLQLLYTRYCSIYIIFTFNDDYFDDSIALVGGFTFFFRNALTLLPFTPDRPRPHILLLYVYARRRADTGFIDVISILYYIYIYVFMVTGWLEPTIIALVWSLLANVKKMWFWTFRAY